MAICKKCLLPDTFPNIQFDENGVCSLCTDHERHIARERGTFDLSPEQLENLFNRYRTRTPGKWDAVVALSGGVDSSVALIELVRRYNIKPLCFHNDHGYEDPIATQNVFRLCKHLNVDLIVWQHDLAFMKQLWKYLYKAQVPGLGFCYICGAILYVNALELARRFGVSLVINGYSKGQWGYARDRYLRKLVIKFIWRVSTDRKLIDPQDKDFPKLLRKKLFTHSRGAFFRGKSETRRIWPFNLFRRVKVIPFYALSPLFKTDKEKAKETCKALFDWQEMPASYPNRTTNCRMVWLSAYADLANNGYTLYHDEYSRLVRLGEMDRATALGDLDFHPPEGLIDQLKSEIGITP